MRQACVSRDGFARVAHDNADATRLLLALLSAADGLDQLATVHAVTISTSGAAVVLRLGRVELEGELVHAAPRERRGTVAQLEATAGFVIVGIRIDNRPLLRAAG